MIGMRDYLYSSPCHIFLSKHSVTVSQKVRGDGGVQKRYPFIPMPPIKETGEKGVEKGVKRGFYMVIDLPLFPSNVFSRCPIMSPLQKERLSMAGIG